MTLLPVFRETAKSVFRDRKSVRWHSALVITGPLLLMLGWSDMTMGDIFTGEKISRVFRIISFGSAAFLTFLAGGWTLDRLTGSPVYPPVLWLRHTPLKKSDLLAGRLLFHLVHSAFLMALLLPVFVLGAYGAFLDIRTALLMTVYLYLFVLGLRLAAESGRPFARTAGSLTFLLYGVAVVIYLLAVEALLPGWSIVRALMVLAGPVPGDGLPPVVGRSLVIHGGIAAAGIGTAGFRLRRAG